MTSRFFQKSVTYWPISLLLLGILTYISVYLCTAGHTTGSWAEQSGTLFEFIFAIITLVGFAYTIHQINDGIARFHDFVQFHYKANDLIQKCKVYLEVIYFTPNIGILTTAKGNSHQSYMGWWNNVCRDKDVKLKAIFLDPSELYVFYKRFDKNYPKTWKEGMWLDCVNYVEIIDGSRDTRLKFARYEDIRTTFFNSESEAIIIN